MKLFSAKFKCYSFNPCTEAEFVQMQLIQQNINTELASIHMGMSGDLKNFTDESAL